jgi:hypothetical protein
LLAVVFPLLHSRDFFLLLLRNLDTCHWLQVSWGFAESELTSLCVNAYLAL